MSSIHMEVGLSVFEFSLRDGLNKRIDMFIADMRQEYKLGRDCRAMTKSEWVEEFKRWTEQKELQRLAEEYILSTPG
jgi:hypothetical protein